MPYRHTREIIKALHANTALASRDSLVVTNADVLLNDITTSSVDFDLTTDASKIGSGAVTKYKKTGIR